MAKYVKGQPRPAGSGRKKGTQNRATIARNLKAAEDYKERREKIAGADPNLSPPPAPGPLDFMLQVMRDPR